MIGRPSRRNAGSPAQAWRVLARWAVLLPLAASVLVACGTSYNSTTSAPSTTPAASASPTDGKRPECANVRAKGSTFADTLNRFISGSATGDEVRSAADELHTAITDARATVSGELKEQFGALQSSVEQLLAALQQNPRQAESVRAAGRQVVTDLAGLTRPCAAAPTS
jgi:TolA-binding protein